jgi:hypothetical protein
VELKCGAINVWGVGARQDLRQFYKRFKHTRVPIMWEENIRLSRWVREQRSLFTAQRLNYEQIHALEQLTFDWKFT